VRLSVELGAERTRLAVVTGAGARTLPSVPASAPVTGAVAGAVAACGARSAPAELVVVHPPHWTEAAVRAALARLAGCATSVRATSSALAAATEAAARTPLPPGPLAVVQAYPAGPTVTVLSDSRSRRVLAHRHRPGGRPTDALAAATAVAAVPPYALTGGVLLLVPDPARWAGPLAKLVGEPPLMPADADRLAVLGALRPARRSGSPPEPAPVRRAVRPTEASAAGLLAAGLLARPRRRRRAGALLAGLALPGLAAVASGLVTGLVGEESGGSVTAAPVEARDGGELAQYGYAMRLPAGWRHSGGLPERRRTLLTPAGAPAGSDLISIEQHPLGYDGVAERDRAVRELGERLRAARAAGAELTGLGVPATVADREFVTYSQRQPLLGAEVDWYVLFEADSQLSIGCQHTPAGAEAVRAACAEVIASVRLRPQVS
jgi:type VII secretion-associated protein (TIGR03931 family)